MNQPQRGIDMDWLVSNASEHFNGDKNAALWHLMFGREVAALGLTIEHIKAMQRACAGMTTEQLKDAAIDYKSALALCAGNQTNEGK